MTFSIAVESDINNILELHKKYHIDSISEQDKLDGFVTTPFTSELLEELITKERGIFIAKDGDRLAGYAMSASWEYWSKWPLFQFMIDGLKDLNYHGQKLDITNSYQYGPVCVDRAYRGTGVFEDLFFYALEEMASRYSFMVTFVNKANRRSLAAHTRRLGLPVVNEFEYGGQSYAELVCPTEISPRGIG
jgi:GNAT superfamily N-acetyltransferase